MGNRAAWVCIAQLLVLAASGANLWHAFPLEQQDLQLNLLQRIAWLAGRCSEPAHDASSGC